MKIFLTGSTGFIGRHLANALGPHTIYKYRRGELLCAAICKFEPDVIFNCAAEIYDSEQMFDSNIMIVQTLLSYCQSRPLVRMIQIGSSSEYGRHLSPTSEKTVLLPTNLYEATKGSASLLCRGYAKFFNLPIVVARPYSVYGLYEKPQRLFPRLTQAYLGKSVIDIYQGSHDFIYIKDFIRGLLILMETTDLENGDIVNFGSGIITTNQKVVEVFESVIGRSLPVKYVSQYGKPFDSSCWQCDPSYAKEKYGFSVHFDLKNGISDYIKLLENERPN